MNQVSQAVDDAVTSEVRITNQVSNAENLCLLFISLADEPLVPRAAEKLRHGLGIFEHAARPRSRCAILQRFPRVLRIAARASLGRSGRCLHQQHSPPLQPDVCLRRRHWSVVRWHLRATVSRKHGRPCVRLHHGRGVQKSQVRRSLLVRERRVPELFQPRYLTLSFSLEWRNSSNAILVFRATEGNQTS